MFRKLNHLATALVVLSFIGCVPYTSKNPLSSPSDAKADMALVGMWCEQAESKGPKKSVLEITAKPGEEFCMQLAEPEVGGLFVKGLFPTHFDSQISFINVLIEDDEVSTYTFFAYEVSGDTLKVSALDPEVAKNAIRNKNVKGVIPRVLGDDGTPEFTGSIENLNDYFGSLSELDFTDIGTFKRVQSADECE